MAKQERYQSNYTTQFQGQAMSFNPDQIGSAVSAQQAENQRQNQGFDAAQQQVQANQQAQENTIKGKMEAKKQQALNLGALANFSKTIAEQITTYGKHRAEEEKLEGAMLYYNNGVPQNLQDQYESGEYALKDSFAASTEIGAELESQGYFGAAREVRNLTGFKAWGYIEAAASDGGLNYGAYYERAKRDVFVNVNGKRINYDMAENLAERSVVEAAIRRQYLNTYKDINPALLNKYLFPKMRETEAKQAIQWEADQAALLQEEKYEGARTDVYQSLRDGNYQQFVDSIALREADFGGPKKTRQAYKDIIDNALDAKLISPQKALELLNYKFIGRDKKQHTLGTYWGGEFGDLYTRAQDEIIENNTQTESLMKADRNKLKREARALSEQMRAEGNYISEDQERQLMEKYASLGGNPSDLADVITTDRDAREEDAKRKADFALENNLPINAKDYYALAPEDRDRYKHLVEVAGGMSQQERQDYHKEVTDYVKESFGMTGDDIKGDATRASRYAKADFDAKVAQYSKTMPKQEAIERALKEVRENMAIGKPAEQNLYRKDYDANQKNIITYNNAVGAVERTNGKALETGLLPGTQETMNQLLKNMEAAKVTGGPVEIPELYNTIALQTNGRYNKYDIADMQLRASGNGSLAKPKPVEAIEKMDPRVQKLLLGPRSTPATRQQGMLLMQASDGGAWKQFMDFVAPYESESYGGYDAMNTGGSGYGTANTAYGSANSANVFEKPISQMAVGEVKELQRQGRLFAAGRYQFIPGTLLDTLRETDIKDEDLFDATTQDKLFIARARWRMRNDPGVDGLRTEWQGLYHAPRKKLEELYQKLQFQPSPFNSPENLTPSVRRMAYNG